MEEIREKFKKVNQTWEGYFWKYKFCHSKINFENQEKINYYSDIFIYLNDTLSFIQNVEYDKDFHKSVFQATGILQTIYAHQDLIDEILTIFKLQKSSLSDKQPNRKIRNELIGHPIRKTKIGNELISSILLGKDFSQGRVNYVLYSKDNNFKGETVFHHLDKIIEQHKEFINKHLDLIWSKIRRILTQFKKTLVELKILILQDIPFEKIINLVEHKFEAILKTEYIFSKEALLYYCERATFHNRYNYSISFFKETLIEYLTETIEDINNLVSIKKDRFPSNNLTEINLIPFRIDIVENSSTTIPNRKAHLDYEFSKLFVRHPVYDISYFKSILTENVLIEELSNMDENFNNDVEYYCSFEYLRKLLQDRGLLESYNLL